MGQRIKLRTVLTMLREDAHKQSGWGRDGLTKKVVEPRTEAFIQDEHGSLRSLWIRIDSRRVWVSGWTWYGAYSSTTFGLIASWRIHRAVKKWSDRRGFGQ